MHRQINYTQLEKSTTAGQDLTNNDTGRGQETNQIRTQVGNTTHARHMTDTLSQ